jgi:hypothetical protein
LKTHQIDVNKQLYEAIVNYDECDYVAMLRPASERYEVGDILHLRETGWGAARCCYRAVVKIIDRPRAVDAQAGPMVGLVLNVWFGERVALDTFELPTVMLKDAA